MVASSNWGRGTDASDHAEHNPFAFAASHFSGPAHIGPAVLTTSSASASDESEGPGGGGCQAGPSLVANLSDSNGATGVATYNAAASTLTVKVTGANPSTSLTITVNGATVGTVSTDTSGDGVVTLSSITAAAGQALTVGDLTGTLAQPSPGHGDCHGGATLFANLSDSNGATGVATYNAAASKLTVKVTGATASTSLTITVNERHGGHCQH